MKPTQQTNISQYFQSSSTSNHWARLGTQKRAGVVAPLFSLYTKKSIGIGEYPDLKNFVDWCCECNLSIIQLLPLNDTGFDFTPYDAVSTFALDPVYLSLTGLVDINIDSFNESLQKMKEAFPTGSLRVNYEIKRAKINLLEEIYFHYKGSDEFEKYREQNRYWLNDYACFMVIKELYPDCSWEYWPQTLRERHQASLREIHKQQGAKIKFYEWLQWQCFEQLGDVKKYGKEKNVLMMGDLPFLVSRDSADVWAHQEYFKLDLASGAPPDMYFAKGQCWGMPPYCWEKIANDQYQYLIKRLKYAEHFYDLYRIDHVVGVFRLWTIPLDENPANGGLYGKFDPMDESTWEAHGRALLNIMINATEMLPCAEDLGTVPECSYRVLRDMGIPGIDVQRWTKSEISFLEPDQYRLNAIAVISTHDTSAFNAWWQFEAGTVDEDLMKRLCEKKGLSFEGLKNELFDQVLSKHGRLRWLDKISDVEVLLNILSKPYHEVEDIVGLYNTSFREKNKYWSYLECEGSIKEVADLIISKQALFKINETQSIFSIQLIQDYLALDGIWAEDAWCYRINFPGTISKENWSLVIPFPIEKLQSFSKNVLIKEMIKDTQRCIID